VRTQFPNASVAWAPFQRAARAAGAPAPAAPAPAQQALLPLELLLLLLLLAILPLELQLLSHASSCTAAEQGSLRAAVC
jgi:hypothetical protein